MAREWTVNRLMKFSTKLKNPNGEIEGDTESDSDKGSGVGLPECIQAHADEL